MKARGKVCPATEEQCHYLKCLRSPGCLRKDPGEAPPFVRVNTREPSASLAKERANG